MAVLDATDKQAACQKCRAASAVQDERTQKLCNACFTVYVRTRPIKRIEALRGNIKVGPSRAQPCDSRTSQTPTFLLALSGGPSSLTLLHALATHIEMMNSKTGRASYALRAVHIHATPDPPFLDTLRATFPSIPITSVLLSSALSTFPLPPSLATPLPEGSDQDRLTALLSPLPPTAKADLTSSLLSHALATFATSNSLSTILLGSSTTALSASVLSLVAKGQGLVAAHNLSDSADVSTEGPRVVYPMRDLLRRDARAYVHAITLLSGGTLADLCWEVEESKGRVRTLKGSSIDELARGYFEEVERGFPGIVHNVVRTMGKLDVNAVPRPGRRCACCGDWAEEGGTRTVVEGMCARCERDFGVA